MYRIAKLVSAITLIVTVAPCFLYYAEMIDHEAVKTWVLIGTIGWFIATPLWMDRELPVDADQVNI